VLYIGTKSDPILVNSHQYVVLEPVDIVMDWHGGSIERVVSRRYMGIIIGLCVLFSFGFNLGAIKAIGFPFLPFA